MTKNPTHPDDSPLKVIHAGTWKSNDYTNYTNPNKPSPQMNPVGRRPGGVVEFPNLHDYQKSKSPEVLEDKRLEQAITQDLKRRNIK